LETVKGKFGLVVDEDLHWLKTRFKKGFEN